MMHKPVNPATFTILLVDDSDDNRSAIAALLRYRQYNVIESKNGREALDALQKYSPDLLLIDVIMPDMNGLDLLESINIHSSTSEAVIMTGYESIDDACRAMELGALSYLRKPIQQQDLFQHVEQALRQVVLNKETISEKAISINKISTAEKKYVDALKFAELQNRRFELLLDSMKEPLIAIDNENNLMIANDAACTTFAIDPRKHLYKHLRSVFTDPNRHSIYAALTLRIQSGESASTTPLKIHDRFFDLSISEFTDNDNNPIGRLLLFNDITEATNQDNLKNSIISIVAHEFRTPLSTLLNSVTLLAESSNESPEISFLRKGVTASINRLTGLVDMICMFSRISDGRIDSQRTAVCISDVIRDIIADFETYAGERAVSITASLPARELTVHTDKELFSTSLRCIISNAIKFSPENSTVTICCSANKNNPAKEVHISVRDCGPGIPEKDESVLFEWFKQGEPFLTRSHGGIGLGLPLARRALELIGGTLNYTNNTQRGCTFHIVLPNAPPRKTDSVKT